jgi:predicted negative regulator of RcsB-dependent stress response
MDALSSFLAVNLPELLSVVVVIIFARMAWKVWKNRP